MLNQIKRVLPLTVQGCFFACLALVILITGLFRADLAALFWGATFLTIALYTVICCHIYQWVFKKHLRKTTGSIRLCFPRQGVFPGEGVYYKLEIHTPRLVLPGFTCSLELSFTSPGEKSADIRHQLKAGKNTITAAVVAPGRGLYKNEQVRFRFQDITGFTSSVLASFSEEAFRVYPGQRQIRPLPYKTEGSESTDRMTNKKQSDELLEVRKYYPGDDTRKINWKILAHLDELFIRKGEGTPPPHSRLLFVIDPTTSPLVPAPLRTDYLDTLVESSCSLMLSQLAKEASLQLVIPGREITGQYTSQNKQELLELMAELWWQAAPQECKLPPRQHLNGVIFSSPGSPALPGIINAFKSRNWKINLFLKDYLFPGRAGPGFKIRNLLFLPEKTVKQPLPDNLEKEFKTALLAELDKYKKRPWKVDNVGII